MAKGSVTGQKRVLVRVPVPQFTEQDHAFHGSQVLQMNADYEKEKKHYFLTYMYKDNRLIFH